MITQEVVDGSYESLALLDLCISAARALSEDSDSPETCRRAGSISQVLEMLQSKVEEAHHAMEIAQAAAAKADKASGQAA